MTESSGVERLSQFRPLAPARITEVAVLGVSPFNLLEDPDVVFFLATRAKFLGLPCDWHYYSGSSFRPFR